MVKDHPPPHPEIIETSSIRELRAFVNELLSFKENTDQAAIGGITGKAGSGKTVGGWACLGSLKPLPGSMLPLWLWIYALPQLKQQVLIRAILIQVAGRPLRRARKPATVEVVSKVLVNNNVELIIFDNADHLSTEHFELVEELLQSCRITVLFLGLPPFWQRLKQHEKLASVLKRFEFDMLEVDEILDVLLPHLKIPHWQFDSSCEQDRELGRYLCKQKDISLRSLRMTLQVASLIADAEEASRIDHEILDKAIKLRGLWSNQTGGNK